MKKFKTSAEKRQIQEANLAQLLSEKDLLRTAFLNYTHLPLGLVVTGLMLATSGMVARPWLSLENALIGFIGIGAVAFFYMLQAWEAFARHRQQLSHVRNSFVGSALWPGLFGLLLLYLALPLGWPVFGLMFGLQLLAMSYHLPLLGRPLKQLGNLDRLLFVVYLTALLWVPLLAPNGTPSPAAMVLTLVCGLALAIVYLRWPRLLHLEQRPAAKIAAAKQDAAHQKLLK
ncbi:MAG: hypothetical protein ACAI44_11960 [Candidatus Sericytochromatia bacterium]